MSYDVYRGVLQGLSQALDHARGDVELPSKTYEHTFPDCPLCANMRDGDCRYKYECIVEINEREGCRVGIPSDFSDTRKFAYCPICDKEMLFNTNDTMANCPVCNHHLNLHAQE